MTIQEKIDEVVQSVENALAECPIPEGDREYIVSGVKELGFQWQVANAHARAACIIFGLIDGHYDPDLCRRFVKECVELKQFDELQAKENAGSACCFRRIPMPYYAALIDLLMVQAIEDGAGEFEPALETNEAEKPKVELVYDPAIADEYRAEQTAKKAKDPEEKTWNGGNAKCYVETVDKVPDAKTPAKKTGAKAAFGTTASAKTATGKTGAGKTPAKKTAAKKTTVRKKASGAADGT